MGLAQTLILAAPVVLVARVAQVALMVAALRVEPVGPMGSMALVVAPKGWVVAPGCSHNRRNSHSSHNNHSHSRRCRRTIMASRPARIAPGLRSGLEPAIIRSRKHHCPVPCWVRAPGG